MLMTQLGQNSIAHFKSDPKIIISLLLQRLCPNPRKLGSLKPFHTGTKWIAVAPVVLFLVLGPRIGIFRCPRGGDGLDNI